MHCYNCGKEIDERKDDAISLDDLNWSHTECLHNPPHSMEDSEWVIDPFDTYESGELPLNDLSKCGDACNCMQCRKPK